MRHIVRLLLLVVTLSCSGCSDERPLTGAELTALFAGAQVEGENHIHGYEFRSVYTPDGELSSYQNGASTPRTARWWISGSQICIRWADRPTDLCRTIVTDGDGHYRKIMTNRRGRERTVVTFRSFTGPDGRDRRVWRSEAERASERRGRILFLIAIVGLLTLVVGGWHYRRTAGRLGTGWNRWRRGRARFEAHGAMHRYRDLVAEPALLDGALRRAVELEEIEHVLWLAEGLVEQSGEGAAQRIWKHLDGLSELTIVTVLAALLERGPPNVTPSAGDIRTSYLLGKAHMDIATRHRTAKSDEMFTTHKAHALRAFDRVRAEEAPPPPDLTASYRTAAASSALGYAALVGPLYESLMYSQHTPPVVASPSRRSSGVADGG